MIQIVILVWLLLGLGLFLVLSPRRAIVFGSVLAFLFLPWTWDTHIWALHSRNGLVMVPLLIGAVLFGRDAWSKLKLCAADVAMAAWCLSPTLSFLANDFEWYHTLAATNGQAWEWGVPYLLGRLFFTRLKDARQLAIAIFIGGLVYVPLCWWEMRMSPNLHHWVYGYHPHFFSQTIKYGGYRPTVFLDHGLTVALFMCFVALSGFWLWKSRSLRALGGIPMGLLLGAVVITLLLCKSLGPILLFAAGCLLYFASRVIRSSIVVLLLLAAPTVYVALRVQGTTSTSELHSFSSEVLDEDRTGSVTYRWMNEDLFVDRALQRPWVGWGGWERWRIHDRFGNDIAVSDALWTIVFGKQGFVGLISLALVFCVPVLSLLRRYPFRVWSRPEIAPAAALAIFVALNQIDALFNTEATPLLMLAAGAVTAVSAAPVRRIVSPRVMVSPAPPARAPQLA